jgi:hypothetical protein
MKRFALLLAVTSVVAAVSVFLLAASAVTSTAVAATALPTISLALDGTSVTIGGTLASGAVNVVSTVTKEAQGEPTLLRLNPGATVVQAMAAVNAHHGDLNYLDPYGAIVFDAAAPKGSSSVQTLLQPGNYVALDIAGNGAAPHTLFTITAAAQPASLPAAQARVSTIDFGFRGPKTLKDGELVRFVNDGFLVHMIDWIRVKDVATARRLSALLQAGKDNQAGRLATGFGMFAGPLSRGGRQQLVVHAKPGVYVLACFMTTQDGREHTQLGMERTIRIVK